jgi:hypothetical protein
MRFNKWVTAAIGAGVGLALGIAVSLATDLLLAPEIGLLAGGGIGFALGAYFARRS